MTTRPHSTRSRPHFTAPFNWVAYSVLYPGALTLPNGSVTRVYRAARPPSAPRDQIADLGAIIEFTALGCKDIRSLDVEGTRLADLAQVIDGVGAERCTFRPTSASVRTSGDPAVGS